MPVVAAPGRPVQGVLKVAAGRGECGAPQDGQEFVAAGRRELKAVCGFVGGAGGCVGDDEDGGCEQA